MGCLSAPKEDPLVILGRVRNNLMTQIELNRIKIDKKEKNIQDLDNQIKQLENDLKQNQYSYSDTEKKQKARQIMGLKKDLLLEEKSLEEARTYNETLNNNKTTIESKIEEIRNMQAISAGDKALANLLKNGNNAINAELGFKDEDDYLKNLLGSNSGGAPTAY